MSGTQIKKPLTAGVAKVPVVMQMEALECGAASLTMILAYYDKWIPLEQIREDCGVSRDGSNAKNILLAARSYGLTAKAYRYDPDRLKEVGKFPMIAHWEFNHFIVVDGFKGDKVYINDPARGTIVMPYEQFFEICEGETKGCRLCHSLCFCYNLYKRCSVHHTLGLFPCVYGQASYGPGCGLALSLYYQFICSYCHMDYF